MVSDKDPRESRPWVNAKQSLGLRQRTTTEQNRSTYFHPLII